MKVETTTSTPHSVLLVMDHSFGSPPESMGNQLISVTSSCVAVGTLSEQDGQTHIILINEPAYKEPGCPLLVFDGAIAVENKDVSIISALDEELLKIPVNSKIAHIRIWVNDQIEPGRIVVAVG